MPLIYEVNYDNVERTVITNFDEIIRFVRDTKMKAYVIVWDNGNIITTLDVEVK